MSRIADAQEFDYKKKVSTSYKDAAEAAGKAGKKSGEARLKEEAVHAMEEAEYFQSSHQTVKLSVNAAKRGNRLDRKSGWADYKVELLVKCIVPGDLEKQLLKRYAPK